jgi:hypothetical protein
MLCAGSTLPVAKQSLDEALYKLSGAVTKLASITFWSIDFFLDDKTLVSYCGKLATMLIIPFSWGSQLIGHFHHHHRSNRAIFPVLLPGTEEEEEAPMSTTFSHVNYAPATIFLAPLPGKKKTSAKGVSHAHPLLCFKFCFILFYLHHYIKNPKKN